jgi:hypothetical protein
MSTTSTIQAAGTPGHRRRLRPSLGAALVLALMLSLAPASPAAAAGSGTVCFTRSNPTAGPRFASGSTVSLAYYDFGAGRWASAGSGYDRRANAKRCATYNLRSTWNQHDGRTYDWSGQYAYFFIKHRYGVGAGMTTNFGMTNGYVTPGTHGWSLHGYVTCWGITCS